MFNGRKPNIFALMSKPSNAFSLRSPMRMGPPVRMNPERRPRLIPLGTPLVDPGPLKPLWSERGWRKTSNGKEYKGRYSAAGRTWGGLIHIPFPGSYKAYIWRPPLDEIRKNTSHGPCFLPNGRWGRYEIHLNPLPSSPDHLIASVERILAQACHGRA